MACRRSQVRSLSGPKFTTRFLAGFLLLCCVRRTKYKKNFCILLLFRPTICHIWTILRSRGLDVTIITPMRPPKSRKLVSNLANQGNRMQERCYAVTVHFVKKKPVPVNGFLFLTAKIITSHLPGKTDSFSDPGHTYIYTVRPGRQYAHIHVWRGPSPG